MIIALLTALDLDRHSGAMGFQTKHQRQNKAYVQIETCDLMNLLVLLQNMGEALLTGVSGDP